MTSSYSLQANPQKTLLSPFKLSESISLNNRIVMAPMTRSFADDNLVPTKEIAKYYERRAGAGLIITEGTIVRRDGQGYPNTPGIFNRSQIDAWKKVTDAVHHKNGKIFCQLWHVGRVSHPKYLNGNLPVAPSAIELQGRVSRSGKKHPLEYGKPRELNISEIPDYVHSFISGAKNAMSAGFDGVEIHGAHGYLIDEFLHFDTNRRTDKYGGTAENMSRFLLEILSGMIDEIGNSKIGVRLSPSAYFNLDSDEKDGEVFEYLLEEIGKMNLVYIHQGVVDVSKKPKYITNSGGDFIRSRYKGTLIGNGDFDVRTAEKALIEKKFDLISFGKPFIANPDLVDKIKWGDRLLPYELSMLQNLY